MGNPTCPHKGLDGKVCGGLLVRQRSGRRRLWVCKKNKKHRFQVSSVLKQPQPKEE